MAVPSHDTQSPTAGTYLPIADHGLIGDLRTAAVVGIDARIDWFCSPRFDSPSIFGSILDAERGGEWSIEQIDGDVTTRQFYLPESNVLVTRFMSEDGVAEVTDLMPLTRSHDPDHQTRIVRRLSGVRGTVRFRMRIAPRFDYGRAPHTLILDGRRALFDAGEQRLHVVTDAELHDRDGDLETTVDLQPGDCITVCASSHEISDELFHADKSEDTVAATVRFCRTGSPPPSTPAGGERWSTARRSP